MRRLTFILFVALAVLCASCSSDGAASGESCGPPPDFAYSEDMARNLDARLSPYLRGESGPFTLETSSQELTSWVTYSALQWPALPVRNAVVWFSAERVHFSGKLVRIFPFSLAVQIHARVWLDGKTPQLNIEEACLGRSALPQWAKRLVERIANETILDSGPYIRLDVLVIRDGEIYALGRLGP